MPAVIQVLKEENGQVVADLTDEIEVVEAGLRFLADEKAWEITLELTGIVMPTPILFNSIAGARGASLQVDEDLVSAGIREGAASFF